MTVQECDVVLGEAQRQYEALDRVSGTTALIREYRVDDLLYTLCFLEYTKDEGYRLDYILIN